jgi:hypothetical protein
MEADILEDIKRQKNRAQRAAQKVTWTMAPSGFANRRGKSQRGPVLGQGPLHPNATSGLKDPRVEKTVRQFYWDSAGRRHPKDGVDDADKVGPHPILSVPPHSSHLILRPFLNLVHKQ